jgi:hypothetical protein
MAQPHSGHRTLRQAGLVRADAGQLDRQVTSLLGTASFYDDTGEFYELIR